MTIVIKARHNGFRRCGIAHPSQPTKYADDFFTEEQLKALSKEPQLILTYEEDEFDQVQDEPNEDISQAALSQATDSAPASQSQASETVIAPVAAPVVSILEPVLVDNVPGIAGAEPLLDGTSDDATVPLTSQAAEVVVAPVVSGVEPVQDDASEPVEKIIPVVAKPEKARVAKPKDAIK
ncbi:HI1506-related protein [Pseudomonas simiae]